MVVDAWPDEEGYIAEGHIIGFCTAAGAIALHSGVSIGTTVTAGVVYVVAGAADGDSIGITLKEASSGDIIPVAFHGVVKFLAGAAVSAGQHLWNDASATYAIPMLSFSTLTASFVNSLQWLNATGTYHKLGFALQAAAASGDEFLLYLKGE